MFENPTVIGDSGQTRIFNQALGGDGVVNIGDVSGLQTALDGKLDDSQLKTTLADNSDSFIASQKAVKTAIDAKADKHTFSATLSDLTLDGATATFFYSEISANASFSISNLVVGVLYRVQVKNTHGSNSITITNPNTSTYVISGGLTTTSLPAGWTQPYELINDGTKIRMWIGIAMQVMG